ncbi:CynX/NimT family MFS transporter [Plantactinospora soyae]|uniref:CP family cyanate transporter-like MFS transporter n=1 Tax=Plantactinospora soyae TaxID=1544732 RepID=A0A927RAY0_9ACTN|nr:MFS transporter [Plantactinospora soyae]MBE1491131.1 CP family cyanate transporter-like MFS transporter [Plantactinospora soyae]
MAGAADVAPEGRPGSARVGWLTLLGIVLLALNLRAAIAAVPPLLPDIQLDLDLGRGAAGLLTTLPVLCFGLLSPLAALLGHRIGIELALLGAMLGIVVGSLTRTLPHTGWLFAGTAIIGAGITVGNVLVPSAVKQHFPGRPGLATGLSTASLTTGATLAAAVSAPLAYSVGLGWRGSLLALGGLATIAALGWLPQLRRRHRAVAPDTGGDGRGSILRSPVTWQLAVFMGTQSMLYYAMLTWLPSLLRDQGVDPTRAGGALALFNLLGIGTALLVPTLAVRRHDQRGLALVICAGWAVGLLGLLTVPSLYPLWTSVAGLAQGASISLTLTLLVLRARTPASARALSGAVQSVGYLLGATGPVLVGGLRDLSTGWGLPLAALTVVTGAMALSALGAGQNRQV